MPPEMPRMIGDFNDNANALWSLHVKEAMSHDEARIQSLKDDMDGVLIFVRVYISVIIFYPELMHRRQGRFILRCSHFLSRRQDSRPSSRSSPADGLLPATECRTTRSDLQAGLLYRPTGLHPIHSTSTLSRFHSKPF